MILLLRQQRPAAVRRVWAPLAATVAVLVVAAAAMSMFVPLPGPISMLAPTPGADSEPEPLSAERQALNERWAAFASTENIDTIIYDFILRVGYPDVVPVSPDHPLPETRAAIIDMRDGRYDAAITKLVKLHLQYPDFDSIAGWLGVALHLSGETDPTVRDLLERGARSNVDPLRRWSMWYGAHHRFLTGQAEEAIPLLATLAEMKLNVGRRAKALLERLPVEELDLADASGDARGGAPQKET